MALIAGDLAWDVFKNKLQLLLAQYGILPRSCEETKRQIPKHGPVLLGLGSFCPKKVTSAAVIDAI
ncbi:hypothetical protein N7488_012345 [Penicillium malachiteum]|nr:hypothetical protein N7488_012345 [Penicillium malachiteum]